MCVDRVTAFIQIRTVASTLYIETPLVRSRSGDGERVSKGRETLHLDIKYKNHKTKLNVHYCMSLADFLSSLSLQYITRHRNGKPGLILLC